MEWRKNKDMQTLKRNTIIQTSDFLQKFIKWQYKSV